MNSPLLTPEEQAEAIVNACRLPLNIHAPDVYCHAQLVKVVAWLEERNEKADSTWAKGLMLSPGDWQSLKELAK